MNSVQKMRLSIYLILVLSFFGSVACSTSGRGGGGGSGIAREPLARIDDNYLYISEVLDHYPFLKREDSSQVIRQYARDWIIGELLSHHAKEVLPNLSEEVAYRVHLYEKELWRHALEEHHLSKLDSLSEEEVRAYYQENGDKFSVVEDMVEIAHFKVSARNKQRSSFRNLVKKWPDVEAKDKLGRSLFGYYCHLPQYLCDACLSKNCATLGRVMTLREYQTQFPTNASKKGLRQGFSEFTKGGYQHLLHVFHLVPSDSIPPFDWVRDEVARWVRKERHQATLQEIEGELWREAEEEQRFHFFKESL